MSSVTPKSYKLISLSKSFDYVIPAPIKFVYARLDDFLPTWWPVNVHCEKSTVLVRFKIRKEFNEDDMSAWIAYVADYYSVLVRRWLVIVENECQQWTGKGQNGSVKATVCDQETGDEEALQAAREYQSELMEILQKVPPAVKESWLHCGLSAITPSETFLRVSLTPFFVNDYRLLVERYLFALWQQTRRVEFNLYPTDPNDPILLAAGLSEEDRKLIAWVNKETPGNTIAEYVKHKQGRKDDTERNRLNKRLRDLRKRLDKRLLRPARLRKGDYW